MIINKSFYDDNNWLSVPISRGRTACSWAESGWPFWIGGFESWAKDKPKEYNQWKFVRDCELLAYSTSLEW